MPLIRKRAGFIGGVVLACSVMLILFAISWEDLAENSRMESVAKVLQAHSEVHRRFGFPIEIHPLDQGKQPVSGICLDSNRNHRSRFEVKKADGATQTIWVSWSHVEGDDVIDVHQYSEAPYGPVFWVGENNGDELEQGWNVIATGVERVMITYKHDYSPEGPSLDGLGLMVKRIRGERPEARIGSINLSDYFRDDSLLQQELKEGLEQEHPMVLEDAMSTTGDGRNPKVSRLASVFSTVLRETPTIRRIEGTLGGYRLVIEKVSFSGLCVYDHEAGRRIHAALWLVLQKDNAEDGADHPATAPESKLEGNEKTKPESEVRPQ